MDFSKDFENCFMSSADYDGPTIELNKKLQDTRHALQESQSEVKQLKEMIERLYSESRVENVAVSEVVGMMKHQLFRNIPLPRNADNLPFNERVGYTLYYMKFLGFATRKAAEEYHTAKDYLESMKTTVVKNTVDFIVERTGELRVPELDGKKEMKKSEKAPSTPPATPPEIKRRDRK